MLLKDLKLQWADDCQIELDKLDETSKKSQLLHSKYLNLMYDERETNRVLLRKRKKLANVLSQYYSGAIDGRDINREPFQQKLSTKSKIDSFIDADDEMIDLDEEIADSNDKILFIKDVITAINSWTYVIGNAINFMKWSGGQ